MPKRPSLPDLDVTPWRHPGAASFPGIGLLSFTSPVDGTADWALAWPHGASADWVVHLHGHGSTGNQLFTRPDLRDRWLPFYRSHGAGVLGPHLRGNSWMAPAAVTDLHALLDACRRRYSIARFHFVSGSMGGTASLIYAALHPEDVASVVALCPATDLARYHGWLAAHPGGVRDEIRAALVTAYSGTPADRPDVYARHSTCRHAGRLTMPVFLSHGDADALIPVTETRALAFALGAIPNVTYREIPGGDHDAPLRDPAMLPWWTRRLG